MIDVMIVEDNETIRQGLALLIDGTEGYRCTGHFPDCETLLARIPDPMPHVILMDIGLPGISGIEGIRRLKQLVPDLNILVLTIYEDDALIFDALCAGACGYLVKKTPPSQLLEAINEVVNGGAPMSSHIARRVITFFQRKKRISAPSSNLLTDREREILSGMVEGKTYQGIAHALHISVDTVRYHIRNIYRKLEVHSVSEAVAKAIHKGLL